MITGNYYEEQNRVISIKEVRNHVFSVWLESDKIAETSVAGQFINVQVGDSEFIEPVLRRPFAIASVEGKKYEIIFHEVGRGTEMLKKLLQPGKFASVLGPLGNGFDLKGSDKEKLLIAGGLGIAPIKRLMEKYISMGIKTTVIWGNRDKSDFFDLDYYMNQDIMLFISSDNGSIGFEGNVLEMLQSEIRNSRIETMDKYDIYAVGPTPMMRGVAEYLLSEGFSCQVSLETPMACGIGVCQGCAVDKRKEPGYLLVCKDGPVFDATDVKF